MTPQDHNKTLAIIYSFLGGLLAAAALVELIRVITLERELERIRSSTELKVLILTGLLLTAFLLCTAYGLLRRRTWARILALISTALSVWLFPLGTALAIYTWWVLHSEGGKQLYSRSSP
jgi:amino acid permease